MRGRDTHYELIEHIADVTKLPVLDTEWLQPSVQPPARFTVRYGNGTPVMTVALEKSGYDSLWRITSLKAPAIADLS
jgi:hypothetical protein